MPDNLHPVMRESFYCAVEGQHADIEVFRAQSQPNFTITAYADACDATVRIPMASLPNLIAALQELRGQIEEPSALATARPALAQAAELGLGLSIRGSEVGR